MSTRWKRNQFLKMSSDLHIPKHYGMGTPTHMHPSKSAKLYKFKNLTQWLVSAILGRERIPRLAGSCSTQSVSFRFMKEPAAFKNKRMGRPVYVHTQLCAIT